MWYEENNNYIRMAVPPSFDSHLQRLENNDDVLFESLSLPTITQIENNTHNSPHPKRSASRSTKIKLPSMEMSPSAQDDPISININEHSTSNSCQELVERIKFLEISNLEKDKEINNLQNEIKRLRQKNIIEKKRQLSYTPTKDQIREAADYKIKYEKLKEQYDNLREALASDGRLKKYRIKIAKQVLHQHVS